MAPPSGGDDLSSYPFSTEHEQDRWRPRATTPTFPPPPSTSAGIDRGSINAKFRELKDFFMETLSDVMTDKEIA
jgi:hypothetical protein